MTRLRTAKALVIVAPILPVIASFYFAFDNMGGIGILLMAAVNAVSVSVVRSSTKLGKWSAGGLR